MKTLVVTGGIGSGKSTVCGLLAKNGAACIYNADSRAKALYTGVPGLVEKLEMSLGKCLKDSDGRFCPRMLAEAVFASGDDLETVEAAVFPLLKDDFEKTAELFAEKCASVAWNCKYSLEPFIVLESATILEKPYFDGTYDRVLLVDAPFEIRLERACRRDGASREAILARMEKQAFMNALSSGAAGSLLHAERQAAKIDAVVMNDVPEDILEKRVDEAMKNIFSGKTE